MIEFERIREEKSYHKREKGFRGYGCISRHIFLNTELSLKAKGLFSLVMSQPPNWKFSIEKLEKLNKDGSFAIQTALEELEAHGFLEVERGKRHYRKYTFHEKPLAKRTTARQKRPRSKTKESVFQVGWAE